MMKIYSIISVILYGQADSEEVLLMAEFKLQSEHLPVTGNNNSAEDSNK